jgi:hypothetical protein
MEYPLTCVSSFFQVKHNKYSSNSYLNWFENTLNVNCPYVFFTSADMVDTIKKYRKDFPTVFVVCDISGFETFKYSKRLITSQIHCPSIELNLIWLEKVVMMKKAKDMNPFKSEWFHWIDAGCCSLRTMDGIKTLRTDFVEFANSLPKDKFIFSSSEPYNKAQIRKCNYYHCISGTSYLLHMLAIDSFYDKYSDYLNTVLNKKNIWIDHLPTHVE